MSQQKGKEKMKKIIYRGLLPYQYNSTKKGAKYTFNEGKNFCNAGDAYEIQLKHCLGFEAVKDSHTSYDVASDIEETKTSVKSWEFTLAKIKGDSFEEILEVFFMNTASTNYSFGWFTENELVEYNMNTEEFKEFLYRFARFDKWTKAVRGPKFSFKKEREVIAWLEK